MRYINYHWPTVVPGEGIQVPGRQDRVVPRTVQITDALYTYLTNPAMPNVIRQLFVDLTTTKPDPKRNDIAHLNLNARGELDNNYFGIFSDYGGNTFVTYMPVQRIYRGASHQFIWQSRQRQVFRPVRWMRYLFGQNTLTNYLIGEPQLEAMVTAIKVEAKSTVEKKEYGGYEYRLVKGDDIGKYYNSQLYAAMTGRLGGSCMRYSGDISTHRYPGTFELYSTLPGARMLIALQPNGKIVGRALFWLLDEMIYSSANNRVGNNIWSRVEWDGEFSDYPLMLMDYPYTINDEVAQYFFHFARDHGAFHYYYGNDYTRGPQVDPSGKDCIVGGRLETGWSSGLSSDPYCDHLAYGGSRQYKYCTIGVHTFSSKTTKNINWTDTFKKERMSFPAYHPAHPPKRFTREFLGLEAKSGEAEEQIAPDAAQAAIPVEAPVAVAL